MRKLFGLVLTIASFAVPASAQTAFNVWTPKGNVVSGAAVGNPTVIYQTAGSQCKIINVGTGPCFQMWYGVFNTGNVNYMESADGLTSWTAYSSNPVNTSAYFPTVWQVGSTYYMYANTSETPLAIALWTASTPVGPWTSVGTVLSTGSGGAWDSTLIAQLVLCDQVSGTYYAYYQGANGGSIFAGGLVTSSSPSGPWTKSASNPVVNTLNGGKGSANVFFKVNGTYYAFGDASYNNAQLVTNNFHAIFRWSAPSASGPWTMLSLNGNQIPVYYPATSADFTSLAVNVEIGDQSMVIANGNVYLYYDVGSAGGEGAINEAIATGYTVAQLVAGYEGVVGAPISGFPQLNTVVLASDSFNGVNANPIGGNWTPTATSGAYVAGQRVSNLYESSAASKAAASYWNALTWGNDQWSQCTVQANSSGSDAGCTVRQNTGGAQTFYNILWTGALGSSGSAVIQKISAGTGTTLQTITNLTVSQGDTLMLVANGTQLLFYWNGYLVGATSDGSITSGSAGVEVFPNGVVTLAQLSGWRGGNFQNAPLVPAGTGKVVIF